MMTHDTFQGAAACTKPSRMHSKAVAHLVDDDARVGTDLLLAIARHAGISRACLRLLLKLGLAVLRARALPWYVSQPTNVCASMDPESRCMCMCIKLLMSLLFVLKAPVNASTFCDFIQCT